MAIARAPRSVGTLCEDLCLAHSTVSEALGKLMDAGLVMYLPEGSEHVYRTTERVSWTITAGTLLIKAFSTDGASVALCLPAPVANRLSPDNAAKRPVAMPEVQVPRPHPFSIGGPKGTEDQGG